MAPGAPHVGGRLQKGPFELGLGVGWAFSREGWGWEGGQEAPGAGKARQGLVWGRTSRPSSNSEAAGEGGVRPPSQNEVPDGAPVTCSPVPRKGPATSHSSFQEQKLRARQLQRWVWTRRSDLDLQAGSGSRVRRLAALEMCGFVSQAVPCFPPLGNGMGR